jgi:hypothetical protein
MNMRIGQARQNDTPAHVFTLGTIAFKQEFISTHGKNLSAFDGNGRGDGTSRV